MLNRLLLLLLRPSCRTNGTRRALAALVRELRNQRRHRGGRRRARRLGGTAGLRLNVGCGDRTKAGWVNVDLSTKRADCRLDLREPLPFADGSAEVVYSEHFLEHLDYPGDAQAFLAECRRVLVPGGRLHVGVPDTEWPVVSYASGDDAYFRRAREAWHPAWCDTRMHNLNWHFRQGGEHRYAYDLETLARVLSQAGFVDVRRRTFDPALDTAERAPGTLYVEARRGGEGA